MLFHIKNMYISISWYFFCMLIWVAITDKLKAFLICFIALILHEFGHIFVLYLLKEQINIFYILPFGFCCRLKNQNNVQDKNMIKILLAGPLLSILVAGFAIFLSKEFAIANFIIGVFNMVPVGYLDGGRLLKIIVNNSKKV